MLSIAKRPTYTYSRRPVMNELIGKYQAYIDGRTAAKIPYGRSELSLYLHKMDLGESERA